MVLPAIAASTASSFHLSVVRKMPSTPGLGDVTAVDELVSVKRLMLGSLAAARRMFRIPAV